MSHRPSPPVQDWLTGAAIGQVLPLHACTCHGDLEDRVWGAAMTLSADVAPRGGGSPVAGSSAWAPFRSPDFARIGVGTVPEQYRGLDADGRWVPST